MKPIAYDIDPGGDAEIVLKGTINAQAIIPRINRQFPLQGERRDPTYDGHTDSHFDNPYCGVFDDDDADPGDETKVEVRMRVSSRHLILASRTFRVMLGGPWSENLAFNSQSGPAQIKASGWDPAAFTVVLDAIHGRYNGIPEAINIGLLCRIASVVDYYDCHQCLRHTSYVWMENLCKNYKKTTTLCKSSLMWLFVSWVFSSQDLMNAMSRIILSKTQDISDISSRDLPLGPILEKIDVTRQELIDRLITALERLRQTLLGETSCPRGNSNCPIMMLGNLMRTNHKLWMFGIPDAPYNGYSVSGIVAEIAKSSEHFGYYGKSSCSCTIKSRLKTTLDGIEKDISTYRLKWFLCSRR
ncbi:hypothetical protein FSHL1_003013 [Fusarium sambucinum]